MWSKIFVVFFRSVYTWIFIIIPIAVSVELYTRINGIEINTNAEFVQLLISFFNDLKNDLPFYDIYEGIFINKTGIGFINWKYFLGESLKGFFDYGIFQLLRYIVSKKMYAAKEKGKTGILVQSVIQLAAVYSTWMVMFTYIRVIISDLLEQSGNSITILLVTFFFFVIAVVRFSYTAKTKMVVSVLWTIADCWIFEIVKTVILIGCGTWVVQIYKYEKYGELIFILFVFSGIILLYDIVTHAVFKFIAGLGLKNHK